MTKSVQPFPVPNPQTDSGPAQEPLKEESQYMRTSKEIGELCKAMLEFHKEVGRITKDSDNPHYKTRYATIDQIIEEVRPPLAKHGLFVVQMPFNNQAGELKMVTRIYHVSGQWMESPPLTIRPEKLDNPQKIGSAVTYARRYSLTSFLALNTGEDDDGNAASGVESHTKQNQSRQQQQKANGQPAQQPDQQSSEPLATQKQWSMIFAMGKNEKGLDKEQIKKLVQHFIKRDNPNSTTRKEAVKIIDRMKNMSREEILRLIGEGDDIDPDIAADLEEIGFS